MGADLIVIGAASGLVAVGAFGGAVRETFKLTSLRSLFEQVVAEPVPDSILIVLDSLGDDEDESY